MVDHAIATLDAYGFADLSMRRLATSLGVAPGAIYWHFANKQTLLLALARVILEAADIDPIPSPWDEAVRAWAGGLRSALLAHRDGAELVASVLALRPADLDPAAPCADLLRAAGIPGHEADLAAATLLQYVVGHTVDAQTHAQALALGVREVGEAGEHVEQRATARFDFGLNLFIAGLQTRLTS